MALDLQTELNALNAGQQAAVKAREREVLVSAGAGSGKTRVLAYRYLDLLHDDPRAMEHILTLTFTRKAAQEMRERIGALLDAHGLGAKRRELMRAPIGTIHGFCERVLREQALQAGIDPNFRVLDEAEAHTLQENALDQVFAEVWSGAQHERAIIGRLLLDYPHAELRSVLLNLYRTARTQGREFAEIAPVPPGKLSVAADALLKAIAELLQLPGSDGWQVGLKKVREKFAEYCPLLELTEFSWAAYNGVGELATSLPSGGPKETAKAARDAIKNAVACWQGTYLELAAHDYLRAVLLLLERLEAAYRWAKDTQGLLDFEDLLLITRDLLVGTRYGDAARDYYRRQFRQVMVDEFQDTNPLQFSLVRAFQGDGDLFMVGDVKQAIYRFIGSDIQVFLAQEARIAGLGATGQRIPLNENYRTRPEVLLPLNALFAGLWVGQDDQSQKFLFEPLIAAQQFIPTTLPAVEMAFWDSDKQNADALRDREAQWIARRILQLTGRLDAPALPVTRKPDSPDALPEARPLDFGDIIILFRASTGIPRYEEALRLAGIPLYVVSGRGFYQAREVQDIVAMLAVLENPWDDFSLAVVLRSPLVGMSDDTLYWLARDWSAWQPGMAYPGGTHRQPAYGRLWAAIARVDELSVIAKEDRQALARFRALVQSLQDDLPAGQPLELIDRLLAETRYAIGLLAAEGGEQRYANVQKLREVAATFQRRGIFDLTDFKRYLTQLEDLAPREANAPLDVEGSQVVRLMTIHAAKGLEAPLVMLADCGRTPAGSNGPFLLTEQGIAGKVPTPEGDFAPTASYRQATERLREEDRRESERLLYVAMTRAREHLICSGFTAFPPADKRASYADVLAGLLELTGEMTDNADLPMLYDDTAYPVRVWSSASLATLEQLSLPPQPPTLWEEHSPLILAGAPLPLLTRAEEVDAFTRVVTRLQPLTARRRQGPLRVGVNRLICYAKCPRQYWFRYLLHREGSLPHAALPPVEDAAETPEEYFIHADGTEFGILLHGVLQQAAFTDRLLDDAPALLASVAQARDVAVTEADRRQLLACLERLQGLSVYPALQRATTLHRELRFLARESGIYVPGIIDVLAQDGERWWILDYKTGHPSADHTRQVGLYALGVQHALGITPERVVLAYLHPDAPRALRDEPVTPALLDEARRLITVVAEGLRQEAETPTQSSFAPNPGQHCAHCPFQALCPVGSLAVPV